jgi:hypothetical protein
MCFNVCYFACFHRFGDIDIDTGVSIGTDVNKYIDIPLRLENCPICAGKICMFCWLNPTKSISCQSRSHIIKPITHRISMYWMVNPQNSYFVLLFYHQASCCCHMFSPFIRDGGWYLHDGNPPFFPGKEVLYQQISKPNLAEKYQAAEPAMSPGPMEQAVLNPKAGVHPMVFLLVNHG